MKLFVKNLTHVDFSYFDATRGLLGESWQTDIVLTGKLNDESMICDFSIVKKQIKKWLDDHIDHMLAIPAEHSGSAITPLANDRVSFHFDHSKEISSDKRVFQCDAPTQAICVLPMTEITPEAVAKWVESQILNLLPAELEAVSVRFSPEHITGAQYQYSHGLKKHAGNCQRIAHGHRSTVEIYADGARNATIEHDWAKRWEDIYLGTQEDLISQATENGVSYHCFSYTSQQGLFELKIDSNQVYMLDCDTTVESLSAHIADVLAEENPGVHIEAHGFEGIGKGAISEKLKART
ncbi:6-carboxytetrahydropterin synthase [Marinomonas foliarum]|uniref:6-carboxy-5,6,7,8-tetrahydropterin synthase n=1 Tax=Marinomonas foliarum TaxID=491950 RepID=A0ABX7IP98_9GAMM|nr:6-carboxytetrahydropterin synthase [Marinomonas foliarum]QRV23869.1 6-carboxytetrahydropterin synthase [Marinomonas foliarum]